MRAVIFAFALAALAASVSALRSTQVPRPAASASALRSTQAPRAESAFGRRLAVGATFATFALPAVSSARPEGVNKPELLPKELVNIIDLEKWLTPSETQRLDRLIRSLEKDTGYRLRVLTQQYPKTPGLAIKDYWAIDANTIILVADLGINGKQRANVINFNVGDNIPLPSIFWSRVQSKYGNQFFVKDNGKDQSILEAAGALTDCLRRGEPYCTSPPASVELY
jgi:hypothetical protein